MKKLLIVILFLSFMACKEKKPEQQFMCAIAQFGVPMFSEALVTKLKTCDAGKISDFILDGLDCDFSFFKGAEVEKKINLDIVKVICPIALKLLSNVAAQGLIEFGCDPQIISQLINDPKRCELFNK